MTNERFRFSYAYHRQGRYDIVGRITPEGTSSHIAMEILVPASEKVTVAILALFFAAVSWDTKQWLPLLFGAGILGLALGGLATTRSFATQAAEQIAALLGEDARIGAISP